MKWMKLAACIAWIAAAVALAQQPTSQPTEVSQTREPPMPRLGRGAWGQGTSLQQEPSDTEWEQVAAFMRENSPQRWEAYEQLVRNRGVGGPALKHFMYTRWKALQNLQQQDEQAYQGRLHVLRLEDEIFGLVKQYRAAAEEARPALKEKIRQKATEIVHASIEQRKHGIERLEKMLESEKQKLEGETRDLNAAIDRRVDAELESGLRPGGRRFAPGMRDRWRPESSATQPTAE